MPAREIFVDTNIFLRVIVKDDPQKATECEAVIDAIRRDRIRAVTSHLVLAEFVWTCLSFYKISKSEVVKLARGILAINHLALSDTFDTLQAITLYEAHRVKFIDALIAAHDAIALRGIVVLSYDKDFDALEVPRIEPQKLLQQIEG